MKNMNEKWIYFDMDGTICDLYSVKDVFNKLDNFIVDPYVEANKIERVIDKIYEYKNNNYKVGIISWLSKITNDKYDEEVKEAKLNWLKENVKCEFDDIKIVSYGVNKYELVKDKDGILVDDDKRIRDSWLNNKVIDPKEWM